MSLNPIPYLYLIVAALAIACGAAPDVPKEYEGEVQLGTLEQPVWAANGYGIDSRQRRCFASRGWGPESRCEMPIAKHAMIGTPSDSGCNQAQIGEIYLALAQLQIVAVSAGWTITTPQPGAMGTWQDAQIFYDDVWPIRCGAVAGAIARTRPWQVPGVNYSCHDVTLIGVPVCDGCRYEVCKFQKGYIDVDFVQLNNLPSVGMSTSQKHAARLNHLKHEYYHVMGLGHEPPDVTSTSVLMAMGSRAINGSLLNTSWAAPMAPTAHEQWLMRSYNPNGDNPNP
jgi:hypothetical protein